MAAELKALRTAAGLTAEQAAAGIGMSAATLSRVENGQSGVKPPILRALLGVYGVDGQAATNLETLAREANQRGWWQPLNVPDTYKTLVGLETEATWINYFSTSFVMGLLQTEAYARALIDAINFDASSDQINEEVSARMRRQQLLPGIMLNVILGEEALLRPVGGPAIMAEQIERLIAVSQDRHIDLQILAMKTGEHVGLAGNFEIIGLESGRAEAVYVEGSRWSACIEDDSEIAAYAKSFERLRALALGFTESRELLNRALENNRS